ncbi:MAG: DUF285 domain-containing protein [Lactobacillaceae bacterium]|jgi:surface protein|nr:DUF285 domain-containing protein [Lactobacillaceae bacterium]
MKIKKQIIKAVTLLSIIGVGTFTPAVNIIVPGLQSVAHAATSGDFGDCTWTLNGTSLELSPGKDGNTLGIGSLADALIKVDSKIPEIITKINIKNGVKANANSTELFAYFPNLGGIEGLDVLDTKDTTNMISMFADSPNLTSLKLDFDTSKVTNMGRMFKLCTNLDTVEFGANFKTDKVTVMESMFENCSNLKTADVSKFNTTLVENMMGMFAGCSNLEVINVSKFITPAVKDFGGMFKGCSKVKELDVSYFDTSKSTWFKEMFKGCSSLEKLDLGKWDSSSIPDEVGRMAALFHGCTSLWKLTLGTNFIIDDTTNLPDPAKGVTFDQEYVTTSTCSWQAVGSDGSDHDPQGDVLPAAQIPAHHNPENRVGVQITKAADVYVWQGVKDEPIIEPSYTVTIPAELPLDTTSKTGTAQVTVGAGALLPRETVIRITPDTTEDAGGNKWTLTNDQYDPTGVAYKLGREVNGDELSSGGYLTFNGNLGRAESQTIYAEITGSDDGFKYAERYTSIINWTINLVGTF